MVYRNGESRRMKIQLFKRKRKKRPDIDDMIWAIKMLTMGEKETRKMLINFRNAVLEFNKRYKEVIK